MRLPVTEILRRIDEAIRGHRTRDHGPKSVTAAMLVDGLGTLSEHGNAYHSPDFLAADGSVSATADIPIGAHKLTGVADPNAAQDAATKAYVDAAGGHDPVTIAADLSPLIALSTQELSFAVQNANKVLAGPVADGDADPTMRALVAADIPDISATYVAKSLYDAQTILAATAEDAPAALTVNQQTVVGRVTGGNIAALTIGIADDNIVQIDDAPYAADNEYAKFTANGIEGRTYAQVMADLSAQAAAAFSMNSQKIAGLAAATETGDAMRFDETPKLAGDLEGTVAAPTVKAASLTVAGKVEIATATETTTGTDEGRAVSPDGLAGSGYGKRIMYISEVVPAATALTTGDAKATFAIPIEITGWNLVNAQARVHTVGTGATLIAIQIRNVTDSADMLSTKITIDASELTSYTAATPSVVDGAHDDVATADIIAVDIDAINNTVVALGLDVILTWQAP